MKTKHTPGLDSVHGVCYGVSQKEASCTHAIVADGRVKSMADLGVSRAIDGGLPNGDNEIQRKHANKDTDTTNDFGKNDRTNTTQSGDGCMSHQRREKRECGGLGGLSREQSQRKTLSPSTNETKGCADIAANTSNRASRLTIREGLTTSRHEKTGESMKKETCKSVAVYATHSRDKLRTAGPWLREIGTCEVWYVQTQDGTPIAIVERGELDGEEHLANANLIAAAPDMAEALRGLFEHCAMVHKHWGDNCNRKEADAAIQAARAALEKAGAA